MPLLQLGHPELVAQDHIQAALENPQGCHIPLENVCLFQKRLPFRVSDSQRSSTLS